MNRNIVKYIAIIAMTLDHIGAFVTSLNPIISFIFRIIGRITFPIMCFFIVEGFKYTRDKKRYGFRLFIFALISQIPYTLISENTIFTLKLFYELNTIFTLFASFSLLWIIESDSKLIIKSLFIVLITAFSFLCDYQIVGLIYTLFFYLLFNNKYKFSFLPILYIVGTILLININNYEGYILVYYALMNVGLILTFPLLYLYNNKSGSKHIIHKYFFYAYYPVHLLILFFIVHLV